jgi:hypothetical protein
VSAFEDESAWLRGARTLSVLLALSGGCGDAQETARDAACSVLCREFAGRQAQTKDPAGALRPDPDGEAEPDAGSELEMDAGGAAVADARGEFAMDAGGDQLDADVAWGGDADAQVELGTSASGEDAGTRNEDSDATSGANEPAGDATSASDEDAGDAAKAHTDGGRLASEAHDAAADLDAGARDPTGDSGIECCPPSDAPGCCMAYGGAKVSGQCGLLCDGMPWPSDPAWRLVNDRYGCPRWTSSGSHSRCCGAIVGDAAASFSCYEPAFSFDASP